MGNMYCHYRNNKYSAKFRDKKIVITTKIKKMGFVNYIDILGKEHDNLFMKEVNLGEVDLVYKESIEVCYKGIYFSLFSSKITLKNIEDNKFMLFTDSEKLAIEYGFEKKEQFVFSKDITKEQIESIKIIQKPIKEFESQGIKEIIIEKEKVNDWLSRISS